MRFNLTLLITVFFGYIYVLIFFTASSNSIGYVFDLLILLFFSLSLIPVFQKAKTGSEKVSPIKFLPILIVPVALIFSSGYLHSSFSSLTMLSSQGTYNTSFFLVLMVLSTIGIMAMETASKVETPLIPAGYDKEEIEKELGFFERSVIYIALASMLGGLGIILLVQGAPFADIGIIPAIILFFIVYVIVITSVVKKES
ncbi:MAG: hypothetical protein M1427_01075 [Candidatus Thermoplasmatota archaeon]|jgi:hypothetical protein|uniref:Multipass membrane protein n=1 Tax=Cuniculiplasma divulgatum TaxID=1673428 RepID=A0A1R4A7Y3_9ARCH|nr:hypothetical protein [Cuniculiplasma divulgatum]MCL4319821.1 hypothetical protein [Candidatus Thermoplasmatota archaeon]WMT49404.1 MAG: hypothetical protein RE472_00200 [Thermoplasmatales archaeon]SJK85081.1 multipass membrane protein [Cuniculiplasma divulgatum]